VHSARLCIVAIATPCGHQPNYVCAPIVDKKNAMNHLTRADYATALQLIGELEAASDTLERFAREGARLLSAYVAAELATLSICDLASGRREGIGLQHALALPLQQDGRLLVSFVLYRAQLDFSERDRERLELVRPHLAWLYAHVRQAAAKAIPSAPSAVLLPVLPDTPISGDLTPREREVLAWLAHGKTDAEIAAFLGTSPRTVHKHLEHIYVKLGVETRTAAVMRGFGRVPPSASPG